MPRRGAAPISGGGTPISRSAAPGASTAAPACASDATTTAEAPPAERICPKTGNRGCRCGQPAPATTPEGRHLFTNFPAPEVHLLPAHQIAAQLHAPETDGAQDLETVTILLEQYRRAFGAMPMGEQNDEIVRRLQGQNPKGLAVLPKTHPAINADGELVDRWGTPLPFHPESALLTLVRSAGPDRKMWTHDDIVSQDDALAAIGQ